MEPPFDKTALQAKGGIFRKLHEGPAAFILPNAWDVGSAVVLSEAGFPALATTSSGVAHAQGYPDGEHIGREEMLAVAGRIAAKVDLPVSVDLEAGYGPRPEDVAETVRLAIGAGLVGGNLEDGTGNPEQPLRESSEMAERIRSAREAADGLGVPFVINARTDGFLRGGSSPAVFDEAVQRANAYRAAGADSLFVPGKLDLDTMARLAAAIGGPLNVLGALSGYQAPSLAEMQQAGVRRVSIGGSLALAALAFVNRAAREMRDAGTFGHARDAFTNVHVNKLMAE